jgi:hypothetical protein
LIEEADDIIPVVELANGPKTCCCATENMCKPTQKAVLMEEGKGRGLHGFLATMKKDEEDTSYQCGDTINAGG